MKEQLLPADSSLKAARRPQQHRNAAAQPAARSAAAPVTLVGAPARLRLPTTLRIGKSEARGLAWLEVISANARGFAIC